MGSAVLGGAGALGVRAEAGTKPFLAGDRVPFLGDGVAGFSWARSWRALFGSLHRRLFPCLCLPCSRLALRLGQGLGQLLLEASRGFGEGVSTGFGKGASRGFGEGVSTGFGKGASTGFGEGVSAGFGNVAATGCGKPASVGTGSVSSRVYAVDGEYSRASKEVFEDCASIIIVALRSIFGTGVKAGLGEPVVEAGEGPARTGGGVLSSSCFGPLQSAKDFAAFPATKAPLLVAIVGAPMQLNPIKKRK